MLWQRCKTSTLFFVMTGCLLAQALLHSGSLGFVDRPLQDLWLQWRGQLSPARHVVIVSLDEDTLSAYPDDPLVFWTDKLAVVIRRLRQAEASMVGLDMLMGISPERWLGKQGAALQQAARDYDQPFRQQLNSGQVVLVASKPGSSHTANDYLLPSPDYMLALPDYDLPRFVGLADLPHDADGVVRRFQMVTSSAPADAAAQEGVPVLSFPTLLALHASGLDPGASSWLLGGRAVPREQAAQAIGFIGPADTIPTLSMKDLLLETGLSAAMRDQLRGKVVLIGAGAGLGDDHLTPYSTSFLRERGRLMTGVEIHANVLETLLSGQRLEALSASAGWLVSALIATASALVFTSVSAWLGVLLWLALVAALLAAGYGALLGGVLMPFAAFAVSSSMVLLAVIAWRLSGEERERARLRQMFGRYVSNQVVESLLQSGVRPELGGKSQTLTVLFADIRNFTRISEQLRPKEVVEMLNTYFERACAVMLIEGGSIDKFIGDAIMVEFGSPLPLADHAGRGIRAALALKEVAHEFGHWMHQRFPDKNLPEFAVGIGLHSGEVVIGNIGSSIRMEFTAIGDTVNLASRIEGKTKELACVILASEATKLAAGGALVTGRSEWLHVKGREAAVNVFEVIGYNAGDDNV